MTAQTVRLNEVLLYMYSSKCAWYTVFYKMNRTKVETSTFQNHTTQEKYVVTISVVWSFSYYKCGVGLHNGKHWAKEQDSLKQTPCKNKHCRNCVVVISCNNLFKHNCVSDGMPGTSIHSVLSLDSHCSCSSISIFAWKHMLFIT